MSSIDARGCSVTGATPSALAAYERSLAAFQSWRSGVEPALAVALQEAPAFVMAHALQAYLLLGSRDPRKVRLARPVLARAAGLPANPRERLHLAAIAAALGDDYASAKTRLGEVLKQHPLDVLALQVVHMLDHITGDVARMHDRVASVMPAWSRDLPGHHAVLAMHAFSLEESGEYGRAEDVACAALALNPLDARAHHAMAHVFEMSERVDAGLRWMNAHRDFWSVDTVVATHGWWHVALFHVAQRRFEEALELYDQRVRAQPSCEIADLIDASALLWRLELAGGDPGRRWAELATAWGAYIDDGFCSFNDLHAMLAFVGARDWDRSRQLERALVRSQALPTRHGESTRQVGLPSCRALIAFGHGNDTLAITLLASLSELAHRLGGSHAQRDVLNLTLLRAVERIRRPARRRPRPEKSPLALLRGG
ncbi:tetratricopeptide repeat protein [Variovorax sp. J22R115]|uniref:tetratricopeptide repeat protein n=1 Tax=Variovorax sp. J22R115 TaxID=3053509 RepID=UPI00257735C7|nr:tetratricopeptide repeat protein [Variovorax sp. J22R115]MDM0051779.1 tetratricopeptide repeat protein [Variovorax sp. J22R115]